MRLLVVLLVLLALVLAKNGSDKKIRRIFDRMLKKEGITLDEAAHEYRLAAFTLSYWALSDEEKESIELMYIDEEVARQNGAKMIEDLPTNEDLQKRSDDTLLRKRHVAPAFYDGRYKKGVQGTGVVVNTAVHQGTCGNCYIHVVVAAMEMAYAKATGKKIKLSEQELTDCYENGCEGGDYRMVAIYMSYIDKLSTRAVYGGYLDGQYTCKADYTPDALKSIKVNDFVSISPDNVEAAVVMYGSVMACMAWGEKPEDACYLKTYKGGMFNGPEIKGGCDHAVLIVGYTPWYYIVKNSHGKTWGYDGYFVIKRGTNACGIEEKMAALVTEMRPLDQPKSILPNGCPDDKPTFCEEINICTKEDKCLEAISKRRERLEMAKRAAEEQREKEEKETQIVKRSSDDDTVDIAKRCADKTSQCRVLQGWGRNVCVEPYLSFCQNTCGKCIKRAAMMMVEETKEVRGYCFRPTITNGRVYNREIMQPGEKLIVRCAKGYTLTGPPSECMIQDLFTNEFMDARLMPECVKLGSNALVGNGADYYGNKNTFKIGNRDQKCGFWNRDVLRGVLVNDKEALKLKLGNHNYCRNPGGIEPVPFCIGGSTGAGQIHYCFSHPGCDVCDGAEDDYGPLKCGKWAAEGKCLYTDKTSAAQVQNVQERCRATCCRIAGC